MLSTLDFAIANGNALITKVWQPKPHSSSQFSHPLFILIGNDPVTLQIRRCDFVESMYMYLHM